MFNLLVTLFQIIALFALRRMKKWAYYVFIATTLLAVLLLIPSPTNSEIIIVVLEVAFLAYLYSLRNKFV